MIRITPLLLLIATVLGIVAAASTFNSAHAGPLNSRWEYMYVTRYDTMVRFNNLGQAGWEMSGACNDYVYFKRRI